jgi:hypothetical protein
MTELGTPDPVDPEIEILPRIVPLPGPVEVPEPAPQRQDPVREPEKVPA